MLDFSPDYIIDDGSGSCLRVGYIHNGKAVTLYGKTGTEKINDNGLTIEFAPSESGTYVFFLTNFSGGLTNISKCEIQNL